jgi:hypothetical protein
MMKEVDRMPFVQKLPEWNKVGVEPPKPLKDGGWAANQKPPADYFNWQWNLVYLALKELQDNGYTKKEVEQVASALVNAVQANLNNHINNQNNPHNVTKSQVGLGNVDNVKQATKTEFDAHNNDTVRHVTQADKDKWNAMLPAANYTAADVLNKIKTVDGSGSGLDADTLDGKDSSAFAQSAFSNVKVGSTNVAADSPNDTLELVAGSNVTLTPDATNDKVTISANVPVSSVNGKTGAVSLTASDVGAETPSGAQAKVDAVKALAQMAKLTQDTGEAQVIDNVDLNTITQTGFYFKKTAVNQPVTNWCYLIVIRYSSARILQYAFTDNSNAVFFRQFQDTNWLPWKQISTTDGNVASATKLQTARTISLSGDASGSASFDGSANASIGVTLANTGVTAGTYPKVTVDAKGRVTAGQALSASDIPNLDWSKITSGKPTTLSGYGITDAVKKSGDTINGNLSVSNANANLTVSGSGNPGIELRSSSGGTPFIDFSNDGSTDYDARVILTGDDVLDIQGVGSSGFKVNGQTVWNAGNDGAGSGLDADTVDGKNFSDIQADAQSRANTAESNAKAYTDQQLAAHSADNVKHITAAERTAWNNAEQNAKAYTDSAPETMQRNIGNFNVYKSGKDSNGIFTTVDYKRPDGTLYARSVLSGGTSPQYTTRTITYYDTNGTTVIRTDVYALTYDANGDLISEVKQ